MDKHRSWIKHYQEQEGVKNLEVNDKYMDEKSSPTDS